MLRNACLIPLFTGALLGAWGAEVGLAQEAVPALKAKQSPLDPNCVRLVLPKDATDACRVVLTHVADEAATKHDKVLLMPEGKIDAMIEGLEGVAKRIGLTGGITQPNSFNNGMFMCHLESNPSKKKGVFASGKVYQGKERKYLGDAITYFRATQWGSDKAGEIDIPLPQPVANFDTVSLPKNCSLGVW